jgi:hypothetical protein
MRNSDLAASSLPLTGIDLSLGTPRPNPQTGLLGWLRTALFQYRAYRMKRAVFRYFDGQPSYLLDDIGLTPLDIEDTLRRLDTKPTQHTR